MENEVCKSGVYGSTKSQLEISSEHEPYFLKKAKALYFHPDKIGCPFSENPKAGVQQIQYNLFSFVEH